MPRPVWDRRVIAVCWTTRKREYVRVDDTSVDSLRGELALLAARFTPPGIGPDVNRAITVACELLTRDLDTPATVAVAALRYGTSLRVAEPDIREMLREQGFPAPGPCGNESEQFTTNLVDAVSQILFRADPAGINFETNTDEYDAEAEAIVIGLPNAHSPEDVKALTHGTFVQWFDAQTAGHIDRYAAVASEIWNLWRSHRYRSWL
jgi:hypothetical protein